MRTIILFLILTVSSVVNNLHAQEVFMTIRSNSLEAINNPQTPAMMKKFHQFKVDALEYMIIKMKEEMPDSSATFLDKEAYAMNNFVNLYLQTVINNQSQPAAHQVKIIKLFMDASYSNPLFNDPDKELTLAYFADGKSLTRFSLDTDWRLAYIAVSFQLEKMK
jgi:hypothetical protein